MDDGNDDYNLVLFAVAEAFPEGLPPMKDIVTYVEQCAPLLAPVTADLLTRATGAASASPAPSPFPRATWSISSRL